jgi:hypothetical protein
MLIDSSSMMQRQAQQASLEADSDPDAQLAALYTQQRRARDEEIASRFVDPVSQEFAIDNPRVFEGDIYNLATLQGFVDSGEGLAAAFAPIGQAIVDMTAAANRESQRDRDNQRRDRDDQRRDRDNQWRDRDNQRRDRDNQQRDRDNHWRDRDNQRDRDDQRRDRDNQRDIRLIRQEIRAAQTNITAAITAGDTDVLTMEQDFLRDLRNEYSRHAHGGRNAGANP